MSLKIQIMLRILVPLQQAEPFGIIVHKGTDAQIFGIVQRAPQPLAGTVLNQQPVAVMNFWPMVVKPVFGVFSEQKHGSQRCNPQLVDFFARIQQAFHIHNGCFAGCYHKFISAGNTWAVKESINGYRIGSPGRTFDPEFPENRKFFTGLYCCVNRQPAGGNAVFLVLCQSTEITGSQKGNQFIVITGSVKRRMQPKTGISDVFELFGVKFVLAVIKVVGRIFNRPGFAVDNLVNRYRNLKQRTQMEKLNLKRQFFSKPRAVVPGKTDVPVLVVIKLFQALRKRFCRSDISALRKFACHLG